MILFKKIIIMKLSDYETDNLSKMNKELNLVKQVNTFSQINSDLLQKNKELEKKQNKTQFDLIQSNEMKAYYQDELIITEKRRRSIAAAKGGLIKYNNSLKKLNQELNNVIKSLKKDITELKSDRYLVIKERPVNPPKQVMTIKSRKKNIQTEKMLEERRKNREK
ncbi:MAG: hypothetical protein PHG03_00125 [Bacilli bacterium]|nr:hypothetical protein [Bacilli bacterium]MDD4794957.1 hypothetical protein [Bacilli bacterium]